ELAGLVGYKLRPGVSASVYPAFTLEQGYKVDIPQGTRAKSLPDSGEMPQSFETAETLAARSEWNELKPRLKKPQNIHQDTGVIYFQGTATNLKPNDTLLLDLGETKLLRRVKTVELQGAENRTKVTLQAAPPEENQMNNGAGEDGNGKSAFEKLLAGSLTQRLSTLPSRQPSNRLRLPRNVQQTFQLQSDVAPRLLSVLKPTLGSGLYQAWQNLPVTAPAQFKVYVFRAQAAPFGHNAPLRPDHYNQDRNLVVYGEWRIDNPLNQTVVNQPARLSAGFSTQPDPPTGINSLTVQFTNQSEGDITEYSWDFGDGATSRERNPEHTFSVGTYTVILTVSGSLGTSTARTTVRVNYLG
ncbi:MAG: PKD domain-containing protein, partial [Coleofasciculus sp. C2-GNP5-27]